MFPLCLQLLILLTKMLCYMHFWGWKWVHCFWRQKWCYPFWPQKCSLNDILHKFIHLWFLMLSCRFGRYFHLLFCISLSYILSASSIHEIAFELVGIYLTICLPYSSHGSSFQILKIRPLFDTTRTTAIRHHCAWSTKPV